MELPFSEDTFVEIVSSEIFDDCVSQDGEFSHAVFAELIKNEQIDERKAVLQVITNFCSMFMKDDENEPFGPMFTLMNGGRSFLPEDISNNLAHMIYKNVDKVRNVAIKARLCDTLWLIKLLDNKENIVCAQKAVECYYTLIDQFISADNFYAATTYLNRVYSLALKMPGTPERTNLFEHLLKYADIEYKSTDSSSLYWHRILKKISGFNIKEINTIQKCYNKTLKIIKNLLNHDFYIFPNDAFYGSDKMRQLISDGLQKNNFVWIRNFYDVAIEFEKKLDSKNINDLIISKAKTFECEAQMCPEMNNFSHWLKEAIYLYKMLPNHKSDVDRLTKEIEQNTVSLPYVAFGHTIDVTDLVKTAQESVAGKDFTNAIFSLVALFGMFFGNSLDKCKAKERVLSIQNQSPLLGLFTQVCIDEHGHMVATASTDEELLDLNMMRNLWIENEISYSGIREAINIINMEHHYTYEDILKLMSDTPFVPDRHKLIMSKGIQAFLKNDMMVAAHFLLCQFEDCLRYLLEHIEPTMKIVDNHEEEKNTSIELLLNKCVEHKIMPEGLSWFFYSYLVAKNKNLRNSIAHGFMSDIHYYSVEIQIVCYGIMYMIFFHATSAYFETEH